MIFESGYTLLVPLLLPVQLWVALSNTRLVSLCYFFLKIIGYPCYCFSYAQLICAAAYWPRPWQITKKNPISEILLRLHLTPKALCAVFERMEVPYGSQYGFRSIFYESSMKVSSWSQIRTISRQDSFFLPNPGVMKWRKCSFLMDLELGSDLLIFIIEVLLPWNSLKRHNLVKVTSFNMFNVGVFEQITVILRNKK